MHLQEHFFDKRVDRCRPFGVGSATTQILKGLIAPVYAVDASSVLILGMGPFTEEGDYSDVTRTSTILDAALCCSEISAQEAALFRSLLDSGHLGLLAPINGTVAGYAWLQSRGVHKLSIVGAFVVPGDMVVFHNDFVPRQPRGSDLAGALTRVRLRHLHAAATGVIFSRRIGTPSGTMSASVFAAHCFSFAIGGSVVGGG